MPTELNVLALVKGAERYVFVYDDHSQAELLDAFRDQPADPALSLTWFDATVLTQKAREQSQREKPQREKSQRDDAEVPPAGHRFREVP